MKATWILLLLALGASSLGCESYDEKRKAKAEKALAEAKGDEEAIEAVAKVLWSPDTYDYEIEVVNVEGDHILNVVATRRDKKTALSGGGSFKDFELKSQGVRVWRMYRLMGDEAPKEIDVRIRLPMDKGPWEVLGLSCDAGVKKVAGFAKADPYETKGNAPTDERRRMAYKIAKACKLIVDETDDLVVD
jgi:hypothetical protein